MKFQLFAKSPLGEFFVDDAALVGKMSELRVWRGKTMGVMCEFVSDDGSDDTLGHDFILEIASDQYFGG